MESITLYLSTNFEYIFSIFWTISLSVIAGGCIGLERGMNGSTAGLRTHILVCLTSTLLMLVSTDVLTLFPQLPMEIIRIDPTRMSQGIMTGIGFLGMGVIIKSGMSIRGLTTAASLWITSAIGILIGVHFYVAAIIGVMTILSTLVIFKWIENVIPTVHFSKLKIVVNNMTPEIETELMWILKECNIKPTKMSYSSSNHGSFEYKITVKTPDLKYNKTLSHILYHLDYVTSFEIQSIKT